MAEYPVIYGRISGIYGRISGIYGRISGIYGRISGIYGRISGILETGYPVFENGKISGYTALLSFTGYPAYDYPVKLLFGTSLVLRRTLEYVNLID